MRNKHKKPSLWANKHLRYIIAIMVFCAIIYYLPVIGQQLGWTSTLNTLNSFHNFYGIDFYGLMFFAPVVYAAYTLGVMPKLKV